MIFNTKHIIRKYSGRIAGKVIPLLLAGLIAGCGSTNKITPEPDGRYKRKPITETTDEILKRESFVIDAKMLEETGQTELAADRYRLLLDKDSALGVANYELSRLLAAKGDIDSAIFLAQRAVRNDDNNIWYRLHLASLYRFTNRAQDNITVWEQIVKHNPDVPEYYYELSNAYLLNNDGKGAIASLNRLEKMVGVTESVSLQKSKIWTHMGETDKAMQEIERLSMSMPNDSRYCGMLAESYMASGQYSKAKECYDRLMATNPDDEYIHISLAEYYKAMKEPRKAYEELRIGMAQENLTTTNKLKILTNFYTSEEFYGKYSEYAYDLLNVAMQDCDDSITYATFYGDVLMHQGKYLDAAHQFQLALTKDSSKYDVWEALLISELSAGVDSTTLESHARRASRLFPLHTLPYYTLAVVEYDKNEFQKAVDLLRRCEKNGFENGYLEPECYMLLGECLNRMNDTLCYGYYEKYLSLKPDDINTMNSYAYRLALDKNNLEKALRLSKRTLDAEPDNSYYLDTYAWILHQMGRDKEAYKYMEKVMKKGDVSDEEKEHWEAIKKGL